MWLRKLVAISMIVSLIGMNALVVVGLLTPNKPVATAGQTTPQTPSAVLPTATLNVKPTVTLNVKPAKITANTSSALSWSTTGNPTSCSASGAWNGPKTPFGAESTGRINKIGNYTYTITCSNPVGSTKASVIIAVSAAAPTNNDSAGASSSSSGSSVTGGGTAITYCGGRLPCYGPGDVSQHASKGNCWGYNLDRVINITSLDTSYHQVKSGISSIEIGKVCGTNLAASLAGQVSAGGQTRNHNQTTKNNADRNEIPYYVGYFDAKKP